MGVAITTADSVCEGDCVSAWNSEGYPVHISSHILRLALLRVFAEAGVRQDDCLSFVEIGERWLTTGLRASDLRAAVQDLVESGDLISKEQDNMLVFALSVWAHRGLYQPDGELQLATPEDEAILFDARYRPRIGYVVGLRRRAEDEME